MGTVSGERMPPEPTPRAVHYTLTSQLPSPSPDAHKFQEDRAYRAEAAGRQAIPISTAQLASAPRFHPFSILASSGCFSRKLPTFSGCKLWTDLPHCPRSLFLGHIPSNDMREPVGKWTAARRRAFPHPPSRQGSTATRDSGPFGEAPPHHTDERSIDTSPPTLPLSSRCLNVLC